MAGFPFVASRRKIGVSAIIIFTLILLGVGASAAPTTSLYSLVPLNSPVVASVDIPWLWNATANIRNNGVPEFGKSLGLSFERELIPWVGQAGFAITGFQDDGPACAIYLQIRNADQMVDASRMEAIVQNLFVDRSKVTWRSTDYKGMSIRRFETIRDYSVLKVATATVDNWLVIAIGDGVIRQVIDTQHGDTPSLATHPMFTKAIGSFPADAIGQFCVNGQGIAAQIEQQEAEMARMTQEEDDEPADKTPHTVAQGTAQEKQQQPAPKLPEHSELKKFFLAGVATASNETLQGEITYYTTSAPTQAVLKQLRTDAGTVTGDSLTQLPDGTFMAFLIKNPDKWIGAMEQMVLNAAENAEEQKMIREGFSHIAGLRDVLQRCAGEFGMGIRWHSGYDFSLTLAGQASTPEDAGKAAEGLGKFIKTMDTKVAKTSNLYTLPETKSPGFLFCWTARNQWLVAATHPNWIKPAAKPLTLPNEIKDANLAVFGNYSYLPQMLEDMGADKRKVKQIDPTQFGQWSVGIKIEEDGSAVRCHTSESMKAMSTSLSMVYPVLALERGKSRVAESLDNLSNLAMAEKYFAQTHHGYLPKIQSTADIRKFFNISQEMLVSPRTNEPYAVNPYVAGKIWRSIKSPSTMIIFYERTPGEDGARCVAYLDGHVAYISSTNWVAAKQLLYIP